MGVFCIFIELYNNHQNSLPHCYHFRKIPCTCHLVYLIWTLPSSLVLHCFVHSSIEIYNTILYFIKSLLPIIFPAGLWVLQMFLIILISPLPGTLPNNWRLLLIITELILGGRQGLGLLLSTMLHRHPCGLCSDFQFFFLIKEASEEDCYLPWVLSMWSSSVWTLVFHWDGNIISVTRLWGVVLS